MVFTCVGVIYPTPETTVAGRLYKGPKIRRDEIDDFIQVIKGKPVHWNHDKSITIGRVGQKVKAGADGAVFANIELFPEDKYAARVIEWIKSGKARGFSVGVRMKSNKETLQCKDLDPIEVSVCEEGAFEGSHILAWEQDKKGKILAGVIRQVFLGHNNKSTIAIASKMEEHVALEAPAGLKRSADQMEDPTGLQEENARLKALLYQSKASTVADYYGNILDTLPQKEKARPGFVDKLEEEIKNGVMEDSAVVYGYAALSKSVLELKAEKAKAEENYQQLHQKYIKLEESAQRPAAREEVPQSRIVVPAQDRRKALQGVEWTEIANQAIQQAKSKRLAPLVANASVIPLGEGFSFAEINAEASKTPFTIVNNPADGTA